MEGWIKIFRKIEENKMYFSEPFTHMQAWIDMILIASYKDMSTIYVRGNKVTVRRGQIGYSKELLASRWRKKFGR